MRWAWATSGGFLTTLTNLGAGPSWCRTLSCWDSAGKAVSSDAHLDDDGYDDGQGAAVVHGAGGGSVHEARAHRYR